MGRTSFSQMSCSVARTLEVIGDPWTPLVVRDLTIGLSRFDTIQRNLGISRKVLTQRLSTLIEHGVVERSPYQEHPVRYDYWLTEKGADLAMVLLAMTAWGDRWSFGEDGPPLLFRHESCGEITRPVMACSQCGEQLTPLTVTPLPGPSAQAGPGTREIPGALARLHEASAASD